MRSSASKAALLGTVLLLSAGGCTQPALSGVRTGVQVGISNGIQTILEEFFANIAQEAFPLADAAAQVGPG